MKQLAHLRSKVTSQNPFPVLRCPYQRILAIIDCVTGWSYPGLADGLSVAIQSAARATSLEVFSKFIGERYPSAEYRFCENWRYCISYLLLLKSYGTQKLIVVREGLKSGRPRLLQGSPAIAGSIHKKQHLPGVRQRDHEEDGIPRSRCMTGPCPACVLRGGGPGCRRCR